MTPLPLPPPLPCVRTPGTLRVHPPCGRIFIDVRGVQGLRGQRRGRGLAIDARRTQARAAGFERLDTPAVGDNQLLRRI